MIKNRKEMYAYIRQDMKRNLMWGRPSENLIREANN